MGCFNMVVHSSKQVLAHNPVSALVNLNLVRDSASVNSKEKYFLQKDSFQCKVDKKLKLNEDAVKLIQFDFSPVHKEHSEPQTAPIDKPWMEFQVDFAVPKNMIDTAKVRKPEHPRLLPYTIWTGFGEDPVYDVLVFGNKKELTIHWKLELDFEQNYGMSRIPMPASMMSEGPVGASVVIGDLDFIGFIYDNFNKQGRIRKHNRKYANAWKKYRYNGPILGKFNSNETDSFLLNKGRIEDNTGYIKNYESISLLDEKDPLYVEKPNHKLLQTVEHRSRFGSFYDPDLYALPHLDSLDSIRRENLKVDKYSGKKKNKKKPAGRSLNAKRKVNDELDDLPDTMDDLYKYMKMKKEQDSIKRAELRRKDKVHTNVYELEQQQKRLKERMN